MQGADELIARGNTLEDRGEIDGARVCYEAAIAVAPTYPRAWVNLSNALVLLGKTSEAIAALQRAIHLGDYAPAELNLGNLLLQSGQAKNALVHYRRAAELRSGWDQAQLGICLSMHAMDAPGSEQALRDTIARHPHLVQLRLILASRLADASAHAAIAVLEAAPADPELLERCGRIRLNLLDHGAAVRDFERALHLDPSNANYLSTYAFYSLYDRDHDSRRFLENIRRYSVANGMMTRSLPRRTPGRIRVGYISGDFSAHALMHYAFTLFEGHDRRQFEVIAVASVKHPDAITEELKQRVDEWIDIADLNDLQAVQRIRERQIDILIDLSGHTAENRLGVLARRAAPLQMTTMGTLSSTGLPNVDYRITDAYTDPPGLTEAWHSEKLLRMPKFHGCYSRQREFADAGPLPALGNGYLTFGYFNHAFKLNRPLLEMWSRVLKRIPDSRIRLVGVHHPLIRQTILDVLSGDQGIAKERIEIFDRVTLAEFSRLLTSVDIAFDPFPYSGGITSIETLLAGIPLLSLAGQRPSDRNGLAILSNLGLQDWVATSAEQWVEIACQRAGDLTALARLRQRLPDLVERSALMDRGGFIGAWEQLLRSAYAS